MEEQGVKNLIKSWYKNKARMESDPIFKFLCLWICFNALLDFRSGPDNTSDRNMIDWLVDQTPDSSDLIAEYENAKQTAPFLRLLNSLASESPIKDPRHWNNSEINIKDENDREGIIRGIYKIRCNLFHGGKDANDARDQKLVTLASRILDKWIGNLVNTWQ